MPTRKRDKMKRLGIGIVFCLCVGGLALRTTHALPTASTVPLLVASTLPASTASMLPPPDTGVLTDEAYRFLSEVEIRARALSEEEKQAYRLTVYRVRKVYPYARLAGERFKLYEDSLSKLHKKRERKAFLKAAEAEIRQDFLEDLKNLTTTQGKILFKLISRQTGHSSYALLRELKSGWSAFSYQVVGFAFGYNLKRDYDPTGEDWMIESIVQQIENGQLKEIPLPAKKPAAVRASAAAGGGDEATENQPKAGAQKAPRKAARKKK